MRAKGGEIRIYLFIVSLKTLIFVELDYEPE